MKVIAILMLAALAVVCSATPANGRNQATRRREKKKKR
jgi:hypothetical protein